MALPTLTTDPILTLLQAKSELDSKSDEDMNRVINMVSYKAKASMSRVQLNQDLDTAIVEKVRQPSADTIYLHAPVYTTDFSTNDLTVKIYTAGTLGTTYTASDDEIIVTSDDFSAMINLTSGACFPAGHGSNWTEVTYYGGWASIPGDVYGGAITQARIDLKRMEGQAGVSSSSMEGQSVQRDQNGVIKEVSTIWSFYRMLI